jgi:DnaJ-class molecular chaperone
MVSKKNLYQILKVDQRANVEEIKKQYYRLCRVHHPDANHNDVSGGVDFVTISDAYRILSDQQLRSQYDKSLASSRNSQKISQKAYKKYTCGKVHDFCAPRFDFVQPSNWEERWRQWIRGSNADGRHYKEYREAIENDRFYLQRANMRIIALVLVGVIIGVTGLGTVPK